MKLRERPVSRDFIHRDTAAEYADELSRQVRWPILFERIQGGWRVSYVEQNRPPTLREALSDG